MSSFLVLSYRHGLAPVAWRLKREGHSVEMIPWSDRYERAWAGKLDSLIQGDEKRNPENQRQMRETVESEGVTVLSDSPQWVDRLGRDWIHYGPGPQETLTSALRVGAWFDGETFQSQHLLVVDRGLWTGARSGHTALPNGPSVDAALTLVRPFGIGHFGSVLEPYVDRMKSEGFRGLCQVGVRMEPGGLVAEGLRAGWTFLHTHALLAALGAQEEELGALLTEGAVPLFEKRFTVVVPVTVPPWPIECNATSERHPVRGLQEGQERHLFWHDVEVDEERRRLVVAGLDGLVAVSRGVASHLTLARQNALHAAQAIRLPEKQYRSDAGSQVDGVLALFEKMGAEI